MEEELLPPGFRFFPTEEELVSFYLRNKLESRRPDICRVIPVVDISKFEPWHLPENSGELCRGDTEQWFFFNPRQEREARGGRPNRTTDSGYWKATGTSSYVYSSDNREIGVKKTMVFYKGKAPTGRKTKWKMHEYKAINEEIVPSTGTIIRKLRHEFSLCRLYVISGTFRAFDRRPMAEVTDDTLLIQQAQGDGAAQSSENAMAAETTSSTGTDSSYSAGNHIDLPPTVGSPNWEMVNPTGPCWDWEQMDWLAIPVILFKPISTEIELQQIQTDNSSLLILRCSLVKPSTVSKVETNMDFEHFLMIPSHRCKF